MTFEKIDAVMAATGAGYDAVKEALIATDGDVERAINLVRKIRDDEFTGSEQSWYHAPNSDDFKTDTETAKEDKGFPSAKDILETIKDIWRKGNASTLRVEKKGNTVLKLPLTVSAIGVILAPVAALIGFGAVLITEYTITIELDNGDVISVNELALKRNHQKKEKAEQSDKDQKPEA